VRVRCMNKVPVELRRSGAALALPSGGRDRDMAKAQPPGSRRMTIGIAGRKQIIQMRAWK
jgi:hypothetical protein